MSISSFVFLQRVKGLSSEKQSFLLDIMEQAKQDFSVFRKNRHRLLCSPDETKAQEKNWEISSQTAVLTMWLIVDNPCNLPLRQLGEKLDKIKNLVKEDRFPNMYDAVIAYNVNDKVFSDDIISKTQKDEYERILTKYVHLSDTDKEFFLNQVRPISRQRSVILPELPCLREYA